MEQRERFRGCLLGLAVGDALGMTVENWPRGSFEPMTDIVGGGPFDRPAGHWTDDTAMAICLATSLVEHGGFDAPDQMDRYCKWAAGEFLESTGTNFDIGGTIAEALLGFKNTGNPYSGSSDPQSSGNGCIMRLAPIPMFFFSDEKAVERYAEDSSKTTHGSAECLGACKLLARIIWRALQGKSKSKVAFDDSLSFSGTAKIKAIAQGSYTQKTETEIRGTGYVVESMEAAMWCFIQTDTFEEALLKAVNLGGDADTTAAVCGQVAGAYYGIQGIPSRWLNVLEMRGEIIGLADRLLLHSS